MGYRSIDTAQAYYNEEGVGQALKESGLPREEFFLTTKVWITNAGYDQAKASIQQSMDKLGTDYLDLLLIHQPFGDYYGTYRAMEELYDQGKLRAIGVSNFGPDRYLDIQHFARIKPAVNQIETHVFQQQKIARGYLKKYGCQVESWGPFAEGRKDMFTNPVLTAIGRKYGKTAAQTALRFLLQSGVVVIPKSVHKERMRQNFELFDFTLTAEDMAAKLAAHELQLNGCALRFRNAFLNGDLGNADDALAAEALELCYEACDYCRTAGGNTVTIWLGHDGFDYSFQIAYARVFDQLVAAFQKVCDYAPDLKISIEYKPYEERAYAFIDSMGMTGMILNAADRPNLGVTLDYCHMLMKHENPAMAVDLFGREGKLYGIHLNDGNGRFDDGLMIGTSTPVKTLEFLYYVKKHGYDSAIYFDTFPVIEPAAGEATQNDQMIHLLNDAIETVGMEKIQSVIDANDAIKAAELVRELFCAMGR